MKFILPMLVLFASFNAHAADAPKDISSAVEAYRFWYPTVSMEGMMSGMRSLGVKDNARMFSAQGDAGVLAFTANQDTPYAVALLDLKDGPMVVEIPAGPFMALVDDHHQRWIVDMGIPGQDGGKGGKYLILPPQYKSEVPQGFNVAQSNTFKVMLVARVIPQAGQSMKTTQERIKEFRIYPLSTIKSPKLVTVFDAAGKKGDTSLLKWESNIQFWQQLAKVINEEPIDSRYQIMFDQLKAFGIEKGKEFKPDAATKKMLEAAAKEGKTQMLTTSFSSDRPDRIKWGDRKWEWLLLNSDPTWATNHDMDPVARDRYFAQAIVMSPAMLKRDPSAGSLYWGAFKDANNKAMDGGRHYKLTVPMPVPARLFWSVTVYDTETRSLIQNGRPNAAIRSLVELKDMKDVKSVDLYFGPSVPAGNEKTWVKTIPGKPWFAYFRIYGPDKEAFEGTWKPGDITEIKNETMASFD